MLSSPISHDACSLVGLLGSSGIPALSSEASSQPIPAALIAAATSSALATVPEGSGFATTTVVGIRHGFGCDVPLPKQTWPGSLPVVRSLAAFDAHPANNPTQATATTKRTLTASDVGIGRIMPDPTRLRPRSAVMRCRGTRGRRHG